MVIDRDWHLTSAASAFGEDQEGQKDNEKVYKDRHIEDFMRVRESLRRCECESMNERAKQLATGGTLHLFKEHKYPPCPNVARNTISSHTIKQSRNFLPAELILPTKHCRNQKSENGPQDRGSNLCARCVCLSFTVSPKALTASKGAPGAGKGSLSAILARNYGFKHISIGDLLRQVVAFPDADKTVAEYVRRGELLTTSLLFQILKSHVEKGGTILLDGFPRRLDQAQAFEKEVCSESAVDLARR